MTWDSGYDGEPYGQHGALFEQILGHRSENSEIL